MATTLLVGTAVAAGSAIAMVTAPMALSAIGFGSAGIIAGSLAATWQSTVYGGFVAAGSLFSVLQSIGASSAAALSFTSTIGIAGAAGLFSDAAAGSTGAARFIGRIMAAVLKCTVGSGAAVARAILASI